MKHRAYTIFTISFAIYLVTVLFTNVSITGFWTDVVISILLSIGAISQSIGLKTNKFWHTRALKATNILCSFIVFGLLGIFLLNPFSWDTFKLRSFYFQSVNGRLFNAYFKPVGAYAGGYGNFWITENPKYFPLIEWRVYWDRTVDHDFNSDTFEGKSIDNYEVVRECIIDEVIKK